LAGVSDGEAELLASRHGIAVASRPARLGCSARSESGPPGRGGRDRRVAGRFTRDDAADRSARGGSIPCAAGRAGGFGLGGAGASHLRFALRSASEGTRGARNAIGVQAVFAESRELDDEVERRPDSLSELREHAFEKVRGRSDGSRDLLQLPLHRPAGRSYAARVAEPFRHRLRVRWSECDLQGVVFYPNYLAYFDHALTELWREAVGPYAQITDLGIDLLVAEAQIRYLASARFDDEVEIVAAITRLGTSSMTMELTVGRTADGVLLAEGQLRHVFVRPDNFEKREMPPEVREGLARFAPAAAVS
jgi:acyl-CoA thioester hydrolase